jgi:hypothetical protein
MTISVGQLHSAKKLLDWVAKNQLVKSDISIFNRVLVCPAMDVLNLCTRCGWLEINLDGVLQLSKRGYELNNINDYRIRLRYQIQDIVSREQPSWSRLFPKGRDETINFVAADIRQCLDEAGLLSPQVTDDIVVWWDEISGLVRGIKSATLSQTGRAGERLTLNYELNRTGKTAIWQSIESNLSGYDVLSCISITDESPLQIEVKTSDNSLSHASFHITSNEWETALLSRNYVFHLWLLDENPKLAIVAIDKIAEHIPLNVGDGEWESVKIPFKVFQENFI